MSPLHRVWVETSAPVGWLRGDRVVTLSLYPGSGSGRVDPRGHDDGQVEVWAGVRDDQRPTVQLARVPATQGLEVIDDLLRLLNNIDNIDNTDDVDTGVPLCLRLRPLDTTPSPDPGTGSRDQRCGGPATGGGAPDERRHDRALRWQAEKLSTSPITVTVPSGAETAADHAAGQRAYPLDDGANDGGPSHHAVRGSAGADEKLSTREVQVLSLVSQGCSNIRIGQELGLSSLTIKAHLGRIGRKLGCGDRAYMVACAIRAGVII